MRALGTSVYRPVDVRIIAATNRDLRAEVNQGRFRADLYFRLAVVRIVLPPLRERPEDIPLLVAQAAARPRAPATRSPARFCAPEFVAGLSRSAWPGNVRELRNYLERCLVFEEPMPLGEDPGAGRRSRCHRRWRRRRRARPAPSIRTSNMPKRAVRPWRPSSAPTFASF